MKGFFVVLLTVLISAWVTAQARLSTARKVGDYWTFPVTLGVRAVFSMGIALGLSGVALGLWGPDADRRIVGSIGTLFVVIGALGWPQTIVFFRNGLKQRTWYRTWKTIPWSDILEVRQRRDGSVLVRGANSKIVFSTDLSGRDQFLQEMERRGWKVSSVK